MQDTKASMKAIIDRQPDDASAEAILEELAFHAMIERGLADVEAGRVLSHEGMRARMATWRAAHGRNDPPPWSDDIDTERLAEFAIALLYLGSFRDGPFVRSWKGLDWSITDLLYARGWIDDPKSRSRSLILTEEGIAQGRRGVARHLANKR